jgi:hypothetical protein
MVLKFKDTPKESTNTKYGVDDEKKEQKNILTRAGK